VHSPLRNNVIFLTPTRPEIVAKAQHFNTSAYLECIKLTYNHPIMSLQTFQFVVLGVLICPKSTCLHSFNFLILDMELFLSAQPVGVQYSITFSLSEFPSYWDWPWYLGLPRMLVTSTFSPFAFDITVFLHPLFFACH